MEETLVILWWIVSKLVWPAFAYMFAGLMLYRGWEMVKDDITKSVVDKMKKEQ